MIFMNGKVEANDSFIWCLNRRTKMTERQTFVLIKHPVSSLYKIKLPWQNISANGLNPNTQVGRQEDRGFEASLGIN